MTLRRQYCFSSRSKRNTVVRIRASTAQRQRETTHHKFITGAQQRAAAFCVNCVMGGCQVMVFDE